MAAVTLQDLEDLIIQEPEEVELEEQDHLLQAHQHREVVVVMEVQVQLPEDL
jgi:hypothetical protein